MSGKGPGKHFRKGMSIIELAEMFPDEKSAEQWFESVLWKDGRTCGKCGSDNTKEIASRKPVPYWCSDCRSYFSVRTGSTIEKSRLPLRKWVFAVYLFITNIKGVSSMKLHRDLKITQKTAWFVLHRLRESWNSTGLEKFFGPVEADETYMGGKRRNMSVSRRAELTGRGASGKSAVAGIKDRKTNKVAAKVVGRTDKPTLQDFIKDNVEEGAELYTDEHGAYTDIRGYKHQAVKHSSGEYVREMAHTNGVESFWSIMKRGHMGIYHHMSAKHLQRYVNEYAGRHDTRSMDTIDQMENMIEQATGKRLLYKDLIQ